jgi:hypothetical protein
LPLQRRPFVCSFRCQRGFFQKHGDVPAVSRPRQREFLFL